MHWKVRKPAKEFRNRGGGVRSSSQQSMDDLTTGRDVRRDRPITRNKNAMHYWLTGSKKKFLALKINEIIKRESPRVMIKGIKKKERAKPWIEHGTSCS